ncbi:RibD domain-containing protein [Geodermatophilus tzadiensis]|uniref:RibD domain-containing protein n=1 Tax=Geodermatophilus tzadiensis TaxID=1137988 RepID=A0A2T0TWJ7_9ACTN|nr:dihydrofolate reductase family protein [Geodermatophilus tzadiensis]PRY50041.1 RibD domain-containing protein [Geodermatophilus tzadiensis]
MPGADGGRTLVGSVLATLDGRLAGASDAPAWAVPHLGSDAVREHRERLHAAATTALLGEGDFVRARESWPAVARDDAADARDRAFASWLEQVEKIVFSTTMTEPGWDNTWVLEVDPSQVASHLRRRRGDDVLVLGGSVVTRLLAVDALDRLAVVWCPEVVGDGPRLFGDGPSAARWALTGSTVSDTGAHCAVYDRAR